MNVACSVLWGGSRRTKPCVFPCKVAAAGDERYLVCAAVAAGVVLVPLLCSATAGCSCVRSSICFLNLRLQIALEWLHECCMLFVVGRKPALCVRQLRLGLVPPLCSATGGCSCVHVLYAFLESVVADRIGMAA